MSNGTLVLGKLSRGKDDGLYSCVAEDRAGRSDSQSVTIKVMGKFPLLHYM